jgi:hypothetical protein
MDGCGNLLVPQPQDVLRSTAASLEGVKATCDCQSSKSMLLLLKRVFLLVTRAQYSGLSQPCVHAGWLAGLTVLCMLVPSHSFTCTALHAGAG